MLAATGLLDWSTPTSIFLVIGLRPSQTLATRPPISLISIVNLFSLISRQGLVKLFLFLPPQLRLDADGWRRGCLRTQDRLHPRWPAGQMRARPGTAVPT